MNIQCSGFSIVNKWQHTPLKTAVKERDILSDFFFHLNKSGLNRPNGGPYLMNKELCPVETPAVLTEKDEDLTASLSELNKVVAGRTIWTSFYCSHSVGHIDLFLGEYWIRLCRDTLHFPKTIRRCAFLKTVFEMRFSVKQTFNFSVTVITSHWKYVWSACLRKVSAPTMLCWQNRDDGENMTFFNNPGFIKRITCCCKRLWIKFSITLYHSCFLCQELLGIVGQLTGW